MKAYTQGVVDYFCGVYAVINAFRHAVRGRRYLSYTEGCLFYQHMMQSLINKGVIEEVLHHGTTCSQIMDYIETAESYVRETFGMKMTADRPYIDTDKSVEQAVDEMGAYLEHPKNACIIRLNNQELGDHWSVGTELTSRGNFKLFDSYGCSKFDAKTALWSPVPAADKSTPGNPTGMPKPPRGKTYLAKEGQILIRVEDL